MKVSPKGIYNRKHSRSQDGNRNQKLDIFTGHRNHFIGCQRQTHTVSERKKSNVQQHTPPRFKRVASTQCNDKQGVVVGVPV